MCVEAVISESNFFARLVGREHKGGGSYHGFGKRLVVGAAGGSQLLKLSPWLHGLRGSGAAKDMTFLMLIRKRGSVHSATDVCFYAEHQALLRIGENKDLSSGIAPVIDTPGALVSIFPVLVKGQGLRSAFSHAACTGGSPSSPS